MEGVDSRGADKPVCNRNAEGVAVGRYAASSQNCILAAA
jgi:hypothetical protein